MFLLDKIEKFEFTNEEETLCKIDDIEYEVKETPSNQRYKHPLSDKFFMVDRKKFFIVSNGALEDYILNSKSNNKCTLDINNCIFLDDISIHQDEFDCSITIRSSFFLENICFYNTKFKQKLFFENIKFLKNLSFIECVLSEFDFYNITFSKMSFYNSKFEAKTTFASRYIKEENKNLNNYNYYNDVDFNHSTFYKQTIFDELEFNKCNFFRAIFEDTVTFSDSIFKNSINFKWVRFKKYLDLKNITEDASCEFDFINSYVERINYNETKFNNFANRESALILKECALKKHDQIKALDFYKQEMDLHKKNINTCKSLDSIIDKGVLWFEYLFSSYGTSPFRPVGIMLVVAFFFSYYISCETNTYEIWKQNAFLLMNPTFSIKDIFEITQPNFDIKKIPAYLEIINLFKNVFFGILIYESIKSFRKFSRKL